MASQQVYAGVTPALKMTRSRTQSPLLLGFGGALKSLRTRYGKHRGRDFSHEVLARVIRKRRPHLSIGGPTLWRWEEGQVGSPDPLVLRELAALFGAEYEALLAVLDANRADPQLSAEDGLRILETHAGSDPKNGSSTRGEPPGLSFEDVLETAASLLDVGDQLHQLAAALLGRQAAVAVDREADGNVVDREGGRSAARALPVGRRRS